MGHPPHPAEPWRAGCHCKRRLWSWPSGSHSALHGGTGAARGRPRGCGAGTALATKLVKPQNLDLKWSLTLRVVTVAIACFLLAAAFALYGTYRELRQANENVADILVKQLQVQLFRIEANIDAPEHFPD